MSYSIGSYSSYQNHNGIAASNGYSRYGTLLTDTDTDNDTDGTDYDDISRPSNSPAIVDSAEKPAPSSAEARAVVKFVGITLGTVVPAFLDSFHTLFTYERARKQRDRRLVLPAYK